MEEKDKIMYAAYIGYQLRAFFPKDDDEINRLDYMFNNITTMNKIVNIVSNRDFKKNSDGLLSAEEFYEYGYEDACKLFDDTLFEKFREMSERRMR